jgi:WD40 repeat protein
VQSIAFSRSGATLAAGTSGGEVSIWDVANASLLRASAADTGPVNAIAFDVSGRARVFAGTNSNRIAIVDVSGLAR